MIHRGYTRFMAEKDVLIFVHIHKTAGTTMHRIIERQFPSNNILSFDHDPHKSINEFKNLSQERMQRIRCLKGHMPFGLHQLLPRTPKYFTVLRHPVERAISQYYDLKTIEKQQQHPLHCFYKIFFGRSLDEHVKFLYERNQMNMQTGYISGCIGFDELNQPYPPFPANAADLAKQNLATKFQVVGLTERFDETLMLMKQVFGFRNIFYTRHNVTRMRPQKNELPNSTIDLIKSASQFDLDLYMFAKQLFEQQIRKQGPSFKGKVTVFRLLNKLYGRASMLYHKMIRSPDQFSVTHEP